MQHRKNFLFSLPFFALLYSGSLFTVFLTLRTFFFHFLFMISAFVSQRIFYFFQIHSLNFSLISWLTWNSRNRGDISTFLSFLARSSRNWYTLFSRCMFSLTFLTFNSCFLLHFSPFSCVVEFHWF